MKDALEVHISGIKCDACDFKDPDVKFWEMKDWLNKPCPKCGANLLTEEDYKQVQFLLHFADIFNQNVPKVPDDAPPVERLSIGMNGTGKMDIKKIDLP